MAEGKDLLQVLWSGADVLRGKMDANEYKTYLLGLVFYKYLSDSYLAKVYDLLEDAEPDSLEEAQRAYEEAMESEDAKDLLAEIKESKHYILDPDMTYISMLNEVKNNSFIREKLQAAFNRIEESDELFNGLFVIRLFRIIPATKHKRSRPHARVVYLQPFFSFLTGYGNPAKNLRRTMRRIKFPSLFPCFRCKLTDQVLICISQDIPLCMDYIHPAKYLD